VTSADYQKGYAAGRRRRARDIAEARVRNERATQLAASIMAAGMRGHWGTTVNGVHKKHNLEQLEEMAVASAQRMVDMMRVY
jgi:hypothetical protein